MLLELKGSQLVVDGKPIVENIRMGIFPDERLIRLKTTALMAGGEHEELDLLIAYNLPKVSVAPPSITIEVEVEEAIRKRYFEFKLSLNLIKRRFNVEGNFSGWRVNKDITTPVEILEIIKSVL